MLPGPLLLLGRVVARAHDHGDGAGTCVRLDGARGLVTVHVRHHAVHENHVGRVGLEKFERFQPGGGRVDADPARFEHALELEHHHLGIVHDQRFADIHRASVLNFCMAKKITVP